ncbi:MAG: CoA-binding protein, partial [Chloroflexia bacterium]|nr:CoA-binding protein [Chloroflexia bacterium]
MENWQANLLHTSDAIRQLLSQLRRVAVLGIRPERMAHKPAHYVPASLVEMGLEIIPVPVLDQDVPTILGRQVYPTLAAIPGPLALV